MSQTTTQPTGRVLRANTHLHCQEGYRHGAPTDAALRVAGTLRLRHQSLGRLGLGTERRGGGMSAFAVTAPRVYENTRGAENKTKSRKALDGGTLGRVNIFLVHSCLVNNTVKSRIEFVL